MMPVVSVVPVRTSRRWSLRWPFAVVSQVDSDGNMQVNMHDAKSNLSRLVAAVESGETDEIEIARAGHVVARLVPARPRPVRTPGYWAGAVRIHPDFDEPPNEVARAFEGGQP